MADDLYIREVGQRLEGGELYGDHSPDHEKDREDEEGVDEPELVGAD